MPKHELFVASPGHGKTFACIERFREEILESPSGIDSQSYFVLPNREHAGRIQHLLLRKDVAGLFNAHILTFQELTQRLLSGSVLPRPTQSLRSHLVNSLLLDPSMEWSYFEPVKDLKGFQELLSGTIQEFKSSMLSIEEFEKRAQPLLENVVFRSKFRDFSILVKRYESALKEMGLADAEDAIRELTMSEEPAMNIKLILFDGFYHFTRAQRAILTYLAPRAEKMVVTLTVPQNAALRSSVFHYCEATRHFLQGLGFSQNERLFGQNNRTQDPALRHLENNIFLDTPQIYDKATDAVQMIVADHAHDEVEMIARVIRENHREKNVHFSDMAVILRSVSPYDKRIEAAFSEYQIPFYIHERRKMIENSALLFVYHLLSLSSPDWEAEAVLALLGSNCLSLPMDERELAELHRRLLRDRIAMTKGSWMSWLRAQADLKTAQARIEALWRVHESLSLTKTAAEYRVRLERELRELGWENSLGEADKSAYRSFQDLCKQWDSFGAQAIQMPDHLRRGIELGLYSDKPSGKNRVQIYDAVMALPKEYKIVFLAGLLEKQFPKEINEDAIFKDAERRQLNGHDGILEERLPRAGGERYFFYMALTRAREQIYLSYPLKDIEGKPLVTSFFVEEALKCFREGLLPKLTSKHWKESADWVSVFEAEKGLARKLFGHTPAQKTQQDVGVALAQTWMNDERFGSVLEAGRASGTALFTDERIKALYGQKGSAFSATRLESYLTCAFKYFANYTLRLKEPLENRERIEMGKVIHEVLENFFKHENGGKARQSILKEADKAQQAMRALLEEAFAKSALSQEPEFRKNMYRERLGQIIALFIRNESWLMSRRSFDPQYHELSFGGPPQSAADSVAAASLKWGDVMIDGKIDRVDVDPSGKEALIVDYKLGERDLWKKLKKGLEVQLPIYTMAVEQLLGLKVVGAELRFLEKDSDFIAGLYQEEAREALGLGGKKTLSPESWEDILSLTRSNAALAAKRLKAADITIRSKSCDFCSFDPVCRFEKWRLIYDEVDPDQAT